ncbi:diguanylate cyclase [Imhoffiella purpurea]|uniref:Diguanylate cyclase n=2 Tax=Imhoffiella purpurea TaxID=1249627 RepID=W9VUD3_9GAMM|nr:diguanylate cyclase [Imhoffiella purpurea]
MAELSSLREQARQILRDHRFESTITHYNRGDLSLDQLLEELHIYHAELLIQQDALRDSHAVNDLALARFVRLYYELPLPALLLSWNGLITDANAAAGNTLALNRKLFTHIANDHHVPVLEKALFEAQSTGKAVCAEVSLRGKDKGRLNADLILIRLPESESKEPEFVCTIVDQTERIAQLNTQQLLADISSLFVNSHHREIDTVIAQVLEQIGRFFKLDCCHLYRLNADRFDLSHTWLADENRACSAHQPSIPAEHFPWWPLQIEDSDRDRRPITAGTTSPSDTRTEQERIRPNGLHSRLALPLISNGQTIGALGLDALDFPRVWSDEEIRVLRMIGENIASILFRQTTERELLASEARYRKVTSIMTDVAYSCVSTGGEEGYRVEWITESILNLTGYDVREVLARGGWRFAILPEDLKTFDTRIQTLEHGQTSNCELRLRHKDGSVRWVRCATECALQSEDPPITRLYGGLVDVTEQKARESEFERLVLVLEQSPSIVLITDLNGTVEYANQKFCEVTGYSREEIRGQHVDVLKSDAVPCHMIREVWRHVIRGQSWRGEFQNRKKSGEIYWEQALITPLRNEHGHISHFVKLAEDVSDKKALSEQLTYLIHYDPLTGLPNRALMRERIDRALASARRNGHGLALLSIDLDKLKFINDTLGHAAGDRLLREVGRRLQSLLSDEDTLARFGGDNFFLLAGRLRQVQDSVGLAEQVNAILDEQVILDADRARITACIGISLYPEDASSTDELIGHADAALHIAKGEGRRIYRFYTPVLNRRLLEQFHLEQALRIGLERGELVLKYQPRVDITTGRILSLEALARWHHPELGLVSPSRFIPIAESTGLILDLGPLVLREACQQIQRWQSAGVPIVPIAVNLSANELYQEDLTHRIQDIMSAAHVEPEQLEFEITESSAMRSIDQAISILNQLRSRGFALSIDDFGTGYASLSYLNRLPMQAIKIDRSFLAEIDGKLNGHSQGAAIVKAIIGLGSNLGIHIIAEGVETQAQRNFLIDHGCNVAQGYLFAWPLTADEIEPLLRAGRVEIPDH